MAKTEATCYIFIDTRARLPGTDLGDTLKRLVKSRGIGGVSLFGLSPPRGDSVWREFYFDVFEHDAMAAKIVKTGTTLDVLGECVGAGSNTKADTVFIIAADRGRMGFSIGEVLGLDIRVELWLWKPTISSYRQLRTSYPSHLSVNEWDAEQPRIIHGPI